MAKGKKSNQNRQPMSGKVAPATVASASLPGNGFGKTGSVPVAFDRLQKTSAPRMSSAGGVVRVAHRELLRDFTGGLISVPVNPGLSVSFPWLSTIASRFEKYRFTKLVYSFQSLCPTSVAGSVMLAMDYDALDSLPETTDKVQMMSYYGAQRCNAWNSMSMNACLGAMGANLERFVRLGNPPSSADRKTYDVGNLLLMSSQAGAGFAGELYVDYIVELRIPQLDQGEYALACSKRIVCSGLVGPSWLPSGVAVSAETGNLPFSHAAGIQIGGFPPDEYFLRVILTGTGLTGAAATIGYVGSGFTVTALGGLTNVTSTVATYGFLIRSTTTLPIATNYLQISFPHTTITDSDVRIGKYAYALG